MQIQYRQGDLLFLRLGTRPSVVLTTRRSVVIVAGEASGHAHRLKAGWAGTVLETLDGRLYLNITHTTQVIHEEHGSITLDPGWWLVVRQREYTPETIKMVAD